MMFAGISGDYERAERQRAAAALAHRPADCWRALPPSCRCPDRELM
jgi:hypothetical protein